MSARSKTGKFLKKKEHARRSVVAEVRKSDGENRKAGSGPVTDVGRRILDFSILANDMWCKICDQPLHFKYMEKEVRRGLAGIFYFWCTQCLEVNQVCPSNISKNSDFSGYPVYTVNCKAALGCLDSRCGHDQFNRILTVMNIPPISHHTLKLAEKKVGKAVENTAQSSCQDALLEEKSLTLQLQAHDRRVIQE